jgi:hypothetical protein
MKKRRMWRSLNTPRLVSSPMHRLRHTRYAARTPKLRWIGFWNTWVTNRVWCTPITTKRLIQYATRSPTRIFRGLEWTDLLQPRSGLARGTVLRMAMYRYLLDKLLRRESEWTDYKNARFTRFRWTIPGGLMCIRRVSLVPAVEDRPEKRITSTSWRIDCRSVSYAG